MASINYAAREISVKIVYYGSGLSGKTTNLQVIHRKVPPEFKSDMVSLATETDRTLFFDFLPLDLGKIKGFSTKFQLYTVPGQVYYNATRKLVLRGVDGIVFVADSSADKIQENLESFQNLEDNLSEYGYKREEIPIIMQYNKRDMPNALPVDILHTQINKYNLPWNEAVANKGKGVFDSLKLIGKIVIDHLNRKYSRQPAVRPTAPVDTSRSQSYPNTSIQQQTNTGYAQPPTTPAANGFNAQNQQRAAAPVQQMNYGTPFTGQSQAPTQQQFNQNFAQPTFQTPAMPLQQQSASDQSSNYGSIQLNPLSDQQRVNPQPVAPYTQTQGQGQFSQQFSGGQSSSKTSLDLEIERYQREIEEKQKKGRSIGGPEEQLPQQQQYQHPGNIPPPSMNNHQQPSKQNGVQSFSPNNRENDYDVYNIELPTGMNTKTPPSVAPQAQDDGEDMYFTSVNPDKQKKPIRKPVNPKVRQQQRGFLSKFFNRDAP